jgi:argininosuccinate synthase
MSKKIVLAYSGGLDTSCAIRWLQEKYGYEVICAVMDVGEGKALEPIRDKALKIGAKSCHIVPLQDEFAQQFLIPAIQANALYEGVYPLISALSRPIIAKALVEIAQQENAEAVAHGCTGKGNDQVRFDLTFQALAPDLKIIAPAREHPISREEAIQYAQFQQIPLPIDLNNPFSIDQNLWGRSCECGILEDPWVAPPEQAYALTNSIENTPNAAEDIQIDFVKGVPVALNGVQLSLVDLISTLNDIAGEHGIGRIDHIENRLIGIKSREVYEAPAALTLIKAHQALEALTLVREVAHFKPIIEQQFARLIYEGLWYSPLREALFAFIEKTQTRVTGCVRLTLNKGQAVVSGRQSSYSLYEKKLATYASDDHFDHSAALGFIELFGLPTKTYYSKGNSTCKQNSGPVSLIKTQTN